MPETEPLYKAPTKLDRAEHKRSRYFVSVPSGLPLAIIMNPNYWVNVRGKIQVHDLFECVCEDGTWEALFRVTAVNKITGEMKFRLLSHYQAEADTAEPIKPATPGPQQARYVAKWNPGKRSWCVQDTLSGDYVVEGCADKASAEAEAADLETRRLAA